MRRDNHQAASCFWILLTAIFFPITLALGFLSLFSLAFVDYIPPDTTLSDWLFSPAGSFSLAFLASCVLMVFLLSRVGCGPSVKPGKLDRLALKRMNAVREKCAAFYERHGRSPVAEDQIEFDGESDDVSFVVLTGEEEFVRLKGKQAIVASAAPWKSGLGWHGVVLWEDGEIELTTKRSFVRDFYRAVDQVLAKRRAALEKNV